MLPFMAWPMASEIIVGLSQVDSPSQTLGLGDNKMCWGGIFTWSALSKCCHLQICIPYLCAIYGYKVISHLHMIVLLHIPHTPQPPHPHHTPHTLTHPHTSHTHTMHLRDLAAMISAVSYPSGFKYVLHPDRLSTFFIQVTRGTYRPLQSAWALEPPSSMASIPHRLVLRLPTISVNSWLIVQ